MVNDKKRARISSDEYTIELESRVKSLELMMKDFMSVMESIKEKDARISELEAQLTAKTCSCSSNVTESVTESVATAEPDVSDAGNESSIEIKEMTVW